MHRFALLPLTVLLALSAALILPASATEPNIQITLPGTNTPRPAAFATNTPSVPSDTPTATATPTS
ncbi:MAG TPA: hypothetical protein VKY59_03775, partial [Spirillospora sp.]|nr:hypothetical protein [Spirillospora sp.]